MMLLVLVLALLVLNALVWGWGADSRDGRDWSDRPSSPSSPRTVVLHHRG